MISLLIEDSPKFVSQLLKSDLFDHFLLIEAIIVTGNSYKIDGRIQNAFYSTDELSISERNSLTYDYWSNFKQICLELIKGKKTPLQLKFVLALSPKNIENLLTQTGIPMTSSDINGLYLNIHFAQNEFHCITGTSLNLFTIDKTLEQAWDTMIIKFFKRGQIPFSNL
ncbi:DUF5721 family protein [Anaerosacchariphilus polymeriproducens]|uniref:Uncharacterized protein n=1 Tax=Anaerosacchariphilus polymeriproducens TaxID=1812858 RepID=A0A371AR50_9FIRM|nr:DUF5721 family protein [Anaerosacchariphilus polymeriproducens]RDU22049.1 hypothetical protein DWV06_16075 [Anaerosacchariphilus polymeriproducens]